MFIIVNSRDATREMTKRIITFFILGILVLQVYATKRANGKSKASNDFDLETNRNEDFAFTYSKPRSLSHYNSDSCHLNIECKGIIFLFFFCFVYYKLSFQLSFYDFGF